MSGSSCFAHVDRQAPPLGPSHTAVIALACLADPALPRLFLPCANQVLQSTQCQDRSGCNATTAVATGFDDPLFAAAAAAFGAAAAEPIRRAVHHCPAMIIISLPSRQDPLSLSSRASPARSRSPTAARAVLLQKERLRSFLSRTDRPADAVMERDGRDSARRGKMSSMARLASQWPSTVEPGMATRGS